MKIFVIGKAVHYASFIKGAKIVTDVEKADIVLFTGGEDVDPSFYGERKHHTTYSNIERDLEEKFSYETILQEFPGKLFIGICRGSQFLTVMNGGKLIQDISNHAIGDTHEIDTTKGKRYSITSTHHQMHYPFNLPKEEYKILAWSSPSRSNHYEGFGIDTKKIVVEPEIVHYHKTNCLCIQGHPEYMPNNNPIIKYLNKLIKHYVK